MPSTFVQANCISGHWVSLIIFLTWVIQSKKNLLPLPSYACESAKKWPFLYWACKSEHLEMTIFVSLCIANCCLNNSIIDWLILMDNCSAQAATFKNVLCRDFDFLWRDFELQAVHICLLDFANSVFVGNVKFWIVSYWFDSDIWTLITSLFILSALLIWCMPTLICNRICLHWILIHKSLCMGTCWFCI